MKPPVLPLGVSWGVVFCWARAQASALPPKLAAHAAKHGLLVHKVQDGYMQILDRHGHVVDSRYTKNEQLIRDRISNLRATPCVWVPSDDATLDACIVYGWAGSFSIDAQTRAKHYCSLQVEGLT
jgi:hypothetical protein